MSAQGSRSRFSIVEEVVYGTTPATPAMLQLPINTHGLKLTKALIEGQEIRSDRMPRHVRHGPRNADGPIVVELRAGDFDGLLESAFMSDFSSNVLNIGTTPKYFTMEDALLDVGAYHVYRGMSVSQMSVVIAPGEAVMATFEMMGRDMVPGTATISGSTQTPSSNNEPFDTFTGTISEGGSPIAYVTRLEFSLNNNLQNVNVIGSNLSYELEYGLAQVTGTVTARFLDNTLLNKFVNETSSSLEVQVDDLTGTNGHTFLFPRIKYTGGELPLANMQGRILSMPFVGLYDSSAGTNLRLTRGT